MRRVLSSVIRQFQSIQYFSGSISGTRLNTALSCDFHTTGRYFIDMDRDVNYAHVLHKKLFGDGDFDDTEDDMRRNLALELHEKYFGGDDGPESDIDPTSDLYKVFFYSFLFLTLFYVYLSRRKQFQETFEDVKAKYKHAEKVIVTAHKEQTKQREDFEKEEKIKKMDASITKLRNRLQEVKTKRRDETKELKTRLEQQEEEYETMLIEREAEHVEEVQTVREETKSKLEMEYYEKNQGRIDKLKEMTTSVSAMENLYASRNRNARNSQRLNKIFSGLHFLEDQIRTGSALADALTIIGKASGEDQLLVTMIGSLPKRVREKGVMSEHSLLEDLRRIRKNVIQRSFVPTDEQQQGWFTKKKRKVLSKFMFTDQSELNSVFEKAEVLLENGRLRSAIIVLEKGIKSGEGPKAIKPWIERAKDKRDISEFIKVIRCHLINLSHSL